MRVCNRRLSSNIFCIAFLSLLFIHLPGAHHADAFTLKASQIDRIAIYTFDQDTDLAISPGSLVWNVTSANTIRQIIDTIADTGPHDCSALGSSILQVIYFLFADGTLATYVYAPPGLHRLGVPGSCRLVSNEGHDLLIPLGQ